LRAAGAVIVDVGLNDRATGAGVRGVEAWEIEAAITPRTVAIFLNTPHNPTGAVLSEHTLRDIADIAKRHDLWLVSDEAYEDVIYAPHKHHSIGSLVPEYAETVISIFSVSKSYAMSGLRTGYIVARSPILHDRIPKLLRCTINGVNSLAQWAALAATTGDQSQLPQMVAEYVERRDALIAALSTIEGVRPFTPRGAFYVWAELDPAIYERLGVADANELSDKLAAIGIGSAPGSAFGQTCDDAIRFAYSCATPMVKEGAEALKKALSDPDVLHGRKQA
jgi:aspartate aminotransferase